MSTREDYRPIDRHTAELLLGGDPAARRAHRRLGELLAAVTAPAGRRELAGEDAALAAFVAAQLAPPPRPRRTEMLKSTLAKLLTVKMAATLVALGGAGGMALAASTGTLPGPLHRPAPSMPADGSLSTRPHSSGVPAARPGFPPPTADLFELCREYSAQSGAEREPALADPHFGALVKQAGRQDRAGVDHFCADLRKPPPSPSGSGSGSPTGNPSGKPPVRPSARPGSGDTGSAGPRPGELPSGSSNPSRAAR
jgi:hypothetical protein